MTYSYSQTHILKSMDVRAIRLGIVSARERQGLNQRELAKRADLDQGHLSKIEDVDGPEMRDLAARIVIQIVERGLGLSLYSFFAELEGLAPPVQPAVPGEEASTVTRAQLDAFRQEIEARLHAEHEEVLRVIGRETRLLVDRHRQALAAARRSAPGPVPRGTGTRSQDQAHARRDSRGLKKNG